MCLPLGGKERGVMSVLEVKGSSRLRLRGAQAEGEFSGLRIPNLEIRISVTDEEEEKLRILVVGYIGQMACSVNSIHQCRDVRG